MFTDTAKQQFGVEPVVSSSMDAAIRRWMDTYSGRPDWIDPDEDGEDAIRTINFAKAICSETARLTTLAIGINLSGGVRAAWLQSQVDKAIYPRLRKWVEYGCAGGTVIFKPNGSGIDVITPDRFLVTETDSNKKITGIIFQDTYTIGKVIYTKLEYHRFEHYSAVQEDGERAEQTVYQISTKTFRSYSENSIGSEVPITETKWNGIEPEVSVVKANDDKIDSMLFGVLTMPEANNIDLDSPLGMSIFSAAMEELKDLDIAYSRNAYEIDNSNVIELLDDTLVQQDGSKASKGKRIHLPSHVLNVFGNGMETFYQQIDRPIKTDVRKIGINQQLSFIGYKCGFSNGYFVFDEKTGMATATQVESDDRRTIQLIKDIRDSLQIALDDTIYAMNVFADLYGWAPVGNYKVQYDFGDITYNEDEDRARNYQLMLQNIIPKWYYLVKFEGFSEDEAKALVDEASVKAPQLFGDEE